MMETFVNFFKIIGAGVIPPPDADSNAVMWYRVRVATVACAALFGLGMSDAFAMGLMPWFDGFARNSDLRYVRIHILDDQLLALRIHHCTATSNEARIEYLRRINILKEEYFLLEHREYTVPPCSDL